MIDFSRFDSLISVVTYFYDEERCKQAVAESRWADGDVVCPYCGANRCVTRKDGRYRCNKCKSNFSVMVGTIFENSKLPLSMWFIAMYFISSHKKGISSHQLARDLNVCQKTAWFMLMRIRSLYSQDNEPLEGNIELDEAYIGGKEKWKHKSMKTPKTQGRSTKTKTPVFGMMERTYIKKPNGELEFMSYVRAVVVENTAKDTLIPLVQQFVKEGSTVFTDEHSAYNTLNDYGYCHKLCCHNNFEFVCEGKVYTNNIECFWSHFRRMIIGCYHNVSYAHLQSYIDEACFRWNTRKMSESERFAQMFGSAIGLVKTNREFVLCCKAA